MQLFYRGKELFLQSDTILAAVGGSMSLSLGIAVILCFELVELAAIVATKYVASGRKRR